ncbi:MAG: methylated-DNA--[protein]-cysteine S-methyltransferase [Marinicella sp.]|nr:methylated-DNA--[protein]-cysteine S-methyltransferase [Xanthomonadales bacterium]
MQVKNTQQIKDYYQALLNKDSNYVGVFFAGVKTTSIFCIPTCRARKPKFENVVFYTNFKDALDSGFRPCKICNPTEYANESPPQVKSAIALVKNNPKEKITDLQLKQQHISPEVVRRWFKKHYGMTFQAFQRMYRINTAFVELKKGKNTTETAFDTGYDSLSGFGYAYKKIIGKSPKNSMNEHMILISRLTTPLGPMFICATDQGVCLLEFVDRRMLETEFRDLQKLLNARIMVGENKHIQQAKKEIKEYFSGHRKFFDVKLHTPGTDFQRETWQALKEIPYGATIAYQSQADYMNKPKAVRAVANANGCNRIAIIIPCHRVIAKDGSLAGYGGGVQRKQWLINHENKHK